MVRYILFGAMVVVVGGGAVFALMYNPLPVEMTDVTQRTVREFIAEDAKTRLDDEFIIAMPISGSRMSMRAAMSSTLRVSVDQAM